MKNLATIIAFYCAICAPARAHVKWFCATADVSTPLLNPMEVFTPTFVMAGLGFTLLVLFGFALDGWIGRRWPIFSSSRTRFAELEDKLLRVATGVYFLILWDKGAIVPWRSGGVILTPELSSDAWWMGILQLSVTIFVIWRRTCFIAALGILILYGFGVVEYGLFHMLDYTFFPGTAVFLVLTSIGTPNALRLRIPALSFGLAFGLMWTGIEKFVFPQWTLSVVSDHPALAFGYDPRFVTVIAGFVEFSLSFFIMFGRGLMRFGAAAFATVFIAAIPEFGHLDAVGHIPIVGMLGVIFLHGASPLQKTIGILDRDPATNAIAITVIYLASLSGFFVAYYGAHAIRYS